MHTTLSSIRLFGALLLVLSFAPQADATAPANSVTAAATRAPQTGAVIYQSSDSAEVERLLGNASLQPRSISHAN